MIEIHIPLPPSANGIWRNVKGRTLASKTYRTWKAEAVLDLRHGMRYGNHSTVTGDCVVGILIGRPRKNADLDNRIKPVLDALQAANVIENDNQIIALSARWETIDGKPMQGAVVRVEELK